MAHIDNMFPSKWIKASDLDGHEHAVTMRTLEFEDVGGDGEKKPVLYFTKGKKGLVLNKTNAKTISKSYGSDTDAWFGKTIMIYPAMVDFRGDQVEAVRVRIVKPPMAPKPAPQSHDEINPPGDMDDDIPF